MSARRRTQGRPERQDPSLAPGCLSGGRLGRQEARLEAVLGARRPVGGCLESQQARPEAVLGARRQKTSVLPTVRAKTSVLPTVRAKTSVLRRRQGDQAAGRPGGREARRQGGQAAGRPGGGVARWQGGQAAGRPRGRKARRPAAQVSKAETAPKRRQAELDNFYIDGFWPPIEGLNQSAGGQATGGRFGFS